MINPQHGIAIGKLKWFEENATILFHAAFTFFSRVRGSAARAARLYTPGLVWLFVGLRHSRDSVEQKL
jgi:hypothetical protein